MFRMKTIKIAKLLLAGTMVVTSLLALGASAKAQSGAFQTGDHWNGFAQSAVSDKTRGGSVLMIDRAQTTGFTGRLLVYGRSFDLQATYAADGSVDASGAGIRLHGVPVLAGSSNAAATFSYELPSLNDRGTVDVLRMYPPDPYKPVTVPPDPCKGSFVSQTGVVGSIVVEHSPPSEHMPPSEFSGTVTFGSQVYNAVGTVAQTPDRDGSYSFQIIGQSVLPGSASPRVHINGRYVPVTITPCIKPGDITPCIHDGGTLTGDYQMLSLGGKALDEGIFQLAF